MASIGFDHELPAPGPMVRGAAPAYTWWMGLALGIGIPFFVLSLNALIFFFVFRYRKQRLAQVRAEAMQEGLLLEAPPMWITMRLLDYRSAYATVGVGLEKWKATVFLTKTRLAVTPGPRNFPANREELGRFTVSIADDHAVHLHSEDPPHATGTIDYRFPVSDLDAWVTALCEVGARRGIDR